MSAEVGPVRWWLIRHAPVVGARGRIYGRLDLDCDLGDGAAIAALAARLPTDAYWLTSPLLRARRTAEALRRALAEEGRWTGREAEIEAGLTEQDFGDWQGRGHAELARERPEENRRFWLAPADHAPPGGESFATLCARMAETMEGRGDGRRPDIVAVCHGGPIRAAVAHALDLPPATALRIAVDTLSLSVLERHRDGAWAVLSVNQKP